MKKFLIFFATLATAATSFAQDIPGDIRSTINLASMNMQNDEGSWITRRAHLKTFISFHLIDIVCAQELTEERLPDFDELKQFRRVEHAAGRGGKTGLFNVIMYNANRFKLEADGRFWFSKTPNEFSVDWGGKIAQGCTWAKFEDRTTKKTFFVFNLQWYDGPNEMKSASARLLLVKLKEIAGDTPFVLAGDFNAPPAASHMSMLANSQNLFDGRKASKTIPFGPVPTEHDEAGIISKSHNRLDYIFVSRNVGVLKYGTMTDGVAKRYTSHRWPIIVQIEILK